MKKEVASAVDFLTQLMRPSSKNVDRLTTFNDVLKQRICDHYLNHWFPEKPFKGSGYRCLRINHNMEPVILKAAVESGLTKEDLMAMLPNELTLWIDPREVSYRIGEDGSVGILYEEEADSHNNNKASKPVAASPPPQQQQQQRYSPVVSPTRYSPVLSPSTSPARSPVNSRAPTPSQHLSPSRPSSVNSSGSGEVSWDILLNPNLFSQPPSNLFAQQQLQHQFQQCSREAYFHHQSNLNDPYDLKRLAAYVYS